MMCQLCESINIGVFPAEINIHHPCRKGLDMPTVWAFPSLSICFDCGFAQFGLSVDHLRELRSDSRFEAAAA